MSANAFSDLEAWAHGVARALRPGGRFVFVEFHPMLTLFETDWTPRYHALGGRRLDTGGVGDYIGESYNHIAAENDAEPAKYQPEQAGHEFSWGVGDVLGALLQAGLRLTHFQEYDFCNGWKPAPDMRVLESDHNAGLPKQRVTTPESMPRIAMMYSLVAEK